MRNQDGETPAAVEMISDHWWWFILHCVHWAVLPARLGSAVTCRRLLLADRPAGRPTDVTNLLQMFLHSLEILLLLFRLSGPDIVGSGQAGGWGQGSL